MNVWLIEMILMLLYIIAHIHSIPVVSTLYYRGRDLYSFLRCVSVSSCMRHRQSLSYDNFADDASIARIGRRVAALQRFVVAQRHVLLGRRQ